MWSINKTNIIIIIIKIYLLDDFSFFFQAKSSSGHADLSTKMIKTRGGFEGGILFLRDSAPADPNGPPCGTF